MSQAKRYSTYLAARQPDGKYIGCELSLTPIGGSNIDVGYSWTQLLSSLEGHPNLIMPTAFIQVSSPSTPVNEPEN